MTDPYASVERQLEMRIDGAHQEAALDFLAVARADLARFNLKRHRVVIYRNGNGLAVGQPRRGRYPNSYDRLYWELRRGGGDRANVIDALYKAGDVLDRLPKEVQQRLEGAIIIGEQQ